MSVITQTPVQSSFVFNLDGSSAPRPKNLFFVRFKRASTSASGWQKDISFLVKSIDRPSIQPITEELNQYGKKRQVHTGYKVGPVRMTVYDTADSLGMQMFAEYAKHYFGDFRHANLSDFRWDVTASEINGANLGYGFSPNMSGGTDNASFFFDALEIYQVFGSEYIQFDLVNPKITTFDPDELSYESSEIGTISMTIAYEAMIFQKDGVPQSASSNAVLREAFGINGKFNGQIDADYADGASLSPSSYLGEIVYDAPNLTFPRTNVPDVRPYRTAIGEGALSAQGQFNFGTTIGTDPSYSAIQNRATMDLSLASAMSGSNTALATALNLAKPSVTGPSSPLSTITTPYAGTGYLDAASYDVAAGAVKALGSGGGRFDSEYIGDSVIQGVVAAALMRGSTPREQVFNKSPQNKTTQSITDDPGAYQKLKDDLAAAGVSLKDSTSATKPATLPVTNSWNSASGGALALSSDTYGVLNAQRPATSQIGFNEARRNGGS